MKEIIFKGCGTAICTPFTEDNKVNYKELKEFIEFQIRNKIDALIVCGTTGEAVTMSEEERKDVIKFTVDIVKGRIPVIAGTGSNNTLSAINMTKYAENIGVQGVLIVTPYYNKTTQNGLIEHYKLIAKNTKLPIILYNVPSRTGVNIEPKTCLELSKIDNIVAIKEASGNISQIASISALCRENLNIYSGNDDQIIPIMSLNGIGVISVVSNILPQYMHDMIQEYFQGNIKDSLKKQLDIDEFAKKLFCEVNPIPIKGLLNMNGFNFGTPRLPLVELSEINKQILQNLYLNLNIS
ncbi:MAG: 4-hydroxy-tetrahydrodipicolinate synthase [Clostridiales bacterium]|nr:4-hydroxy-tetrahydrodipicolinate synthase [Clostridiales bacterium]